MDFYLHSLLSCTIPELICQDVETLKSKVYQQTHVASLDEVQENMVGSMCRGRHGAADTAHNLKKRHLNDHMCVIQQLQFPRVLERK